MRECRVGRPAIYRFKDFGECSGVRGPFFGKFVEDNFKLLIPRPGLAYSCDVIIGPYCSNLLHRSVLHV